MDHNHAENFVSIDAAPLPLLPEGLYDFRTVKIDRRRLWGSIKIMLECEVVGGQYDGVRLLWCARAIPKGRRVPISSKLYRTIVMILGRRPARANAFPTGFWCRSCYGDVSAPSCGALTADHCRIARAIRSSTTSSSGSPDGPVPLPAPVPVPPCPGVKSLPNAYLCNTRRGFLRVGFVSG
jgi:hypothetical protein